MIEADSNIALDFDTVIFDAERNAVGRVHFFLLFLIEINKRKQIL